MADRITDRALIDLYQKTTTGRWAVASGDNMKFHIYSIDSSPIKYILREAPDEVSNYDLRLMSLAKQLAEEVLQYRLVNRRLKDGKED